MVAKEPLVWLIEPYRLDTTAVQYGSIGGYGTHAYTSEEEMSWLTGTPER